MKKSLISSFILAACYFLLSAPSIAQPGAIDPSFNPTDIGFGNGDGANNSVLTSSFQSDGYRQTKMPTIQFDSS